MGMDGPPRKTELVGDLLVAETVDEEPYDLELARR
jgi:hypothetical protein